MKVEYLGQLTSLLAFILSIFSVYLSRKQKTLDNLITLQTFLHSQDLSEARRAIREGDVVISLKDGSVRRVCSSFDFAGMLVRTKAVNEKMFFEYWRIPLVSLARPFAEFFEGQTGSVSLKDYYKDFWWILCRAQAEIKNQA